MRLSYKPIDRAGRMRLLALCWTGFLLVFFTFSSTQEYYSMPCYPALALLHRLCCWRRQILDPGRPPGHLPPSPPLAALVIVVILAQVWNLPTPGDISSALTAHPEAYTLSLGHMGDLTLQSFAYLARAVDHCGHRFRDRRVGPLVAAARSSVMS